MGPQAGEMAVLGCPVDRHHFRHLRAVTHERTGITKSSAPGIRLADSTSRVSPWTTSEDSGESAAPGIGCTHRTYLLEPPVTRS